jgi:ABC-type branched-subunit amino acid transport system ATPase component
VRAQQAMLEQAVRTLADSPGVRAQQAMLEQAVRTLADSPGVRAQQAMLEQTVQALVNSTGLLRTQQAMVEQAMQVLTRSGLLEKLEDAALEVEPGGRAVSDASVTVLAILAALIVLSALTGFRLEEWNRSGQDFESLDRFSLLSDADLIAGWTASAYFLTQQALRALVNRGAARPRD